MPSNQNNVGVPAENIWGGPLGRIIVCPSGARCMVRSLDMLDIVEAGLIEQMDSLGGIVDKDHIQRVQGKTKRKPSDRAPKKLTKAQEEAKNSKQLEDMLRNPSQFAAMDKMLNKVVAATVLEPVIESPYIDIDPEDPSKGERKRTASERLEHTIYADSVGFADRMFIFEEVFEGMAGLENFRSGSESDVADVADESESAEDAS